MNNSIIIRNADFSTAKVDELKIQKLTVTKAGNGTQRVVGGALSLQADSATWKPSENCAYSNEIILPAGTKYIFGKISAISNQTNFDADYANALGSTLRTVSPVFLYYSEAQEAWTELLTYYCGSHEYLPDIVAATRDISAIGQTCIAYTSNGAIFGQVLAPSYEISKIIVDWIRPDNKIAPQIGLELPEIYAGF